MAAKKVDNAPEEILVPEEPVIEADAPVVVEEAIPANEALAYAAPDTANPLIPLIVGLVSAAVTGFGFWLYGRIKRKKNAPIETIPFVPDDGGTTDDVPPVEIGGDPEVRLVDDNTTEAAAE